MTTLVIERKRTLEMISQTETEYREQFLKSLRERIALALSKNQFYESNILIDYYGEVGSYSG